MSPQKLTLYGQTVMVDHEDAPKGYYPVPKDAVPQYENICRACDWRPDCNAKICSCMSYNRADGISVVFKKGV
jgi:hypothetical protein